MTAKSADKMRVMLPALRRATADYMASEGCACCRDQEKHTKARRELAILLEVPVDSDGYADFSQYRSDR